MFTVFFKSWYNNYSDPVEFEYFDNEAAAIDRAKEMYSYYVDYIGNNNYVANGLETWVENQNGFKIYEGHLE